MTTDTAGLTELERDLLEFARLRFKRPGARDTAIRDRFDMTPVRHAQVLGALLNQPGALVYDAALVRRLVRLRDARRGERRGLEGHGE